MSLEDLDVAKFLGGVVLAAALGYVALSWLRSRTSTTQSTAAIWAKSLVFATLFFIVFMVALPWGAHLLLPQPLPIPSPVRNWAGVFLFAAGVAGWLACLDTFSRRGRGTPSPFDAPRTLVTGGLFGIVRNPIIASELMVVWGEALYFASVGILIYALLITVGAHLGVARSEEPLLRKRFGAGYEAYCRRVPRWLPRLTRTR